MKGLRIGIIGHGNMGNAILKGIVKKNVTHIDNIIVTDTRNSAMEEAKRVSGCRAGGLSAVIDGSDYLIIAVEPWDSKGLLSEISGNISGQTIISIMAGVRISTMESILGNENETPIARAMPNMAAMVGESATCVSFNAALTRKKEVKEILSSVGTVIEVDEFALDAATAIAGSGPAYFFYLADSLIIAGEKIGLDRAVARELVAQTVYGASLLMKNGCGSGEDIDIKDMIRKVASKGGTTQAALAVFEKNGMDDIIARAVIRAKERSGELSG
ncbi:MAG: pyrroline-5-carboxylate reductase [Candidatus Omnitrophica bacterium]|nr:pyrroline-5-carboxylate reductase [Candidatus Omnitrophota bacterium]MBU1128804.1 pyrroline-5-carboxylate reductase [Candidatus Omnitrophota bacterium]MBU1785140.1 pyrroline-5-carboxylate reductase [Candidatus Omnitrophota bacterium]MBU1851203.1 pyrroline-5-carboxylate reductase [Candidatus Omnitrophota bacterium]